MEHNESVISQISLENSIDCIDLNVEHAPVERNIERPRTRINRKLAFVTF